METSGINAAIHELEREVKRVQEAIATLRKIQAQRSGKVKQKGRRLSVQARKRISEAAKKRWAAYRKKQKNGKKST